MAPATTHLFHIFGREDAQPARATPLRVIKSVNHESFALHTPERKCWITELIVARAVQARHKQGQVKRVA